MEKYVIICDSQKNIGQKLMMVDRNRFKDQWWTESIHKAIIFDKESAANFSCAKMKYNNPTVISLTKAKELFDKVVQVKRVKTSWLESALNRKETEWHDDDWYEGIND